MPRRWNFAIDQKLKTELCPGGAGHASGERPHTKAQCVLCRTLAHTEPLAPAPTPEAEKPVETPKKKKSFV